MNERAKVLQELLRIKKREVKVSPRLGICMMLHSKGFSWDILMDIIVPLFKTWEHFSGYGKFPIPSTNKEYNSAQYFYESRNLWWGKQGKLRWSLIDHMITCLENETSLSPTQTKRLTYNEKI